MVTYEDGSEEKVVSTDIWHSADRPSGQPTLDTICWAVQDFSELKGWHIFDIRDDEEIAEEPLGLPADHTPFCSFNAETFQPCGDGWTLLVCRTGMRSYRMAAELRRKGHERIWSLQGGVVRLKVLAAQSQVS
jgi:rhodanese-related sulfurtransferase